MISSLLEKGELGLKDQSVTRKPTNLNRLSQSCQKTVQLCNLDSDGDGVLLTSTKDVVGRRVEYFEDLFYPKSTPPNLKAVLELKIGLSNRWC